MGILAISIPMSISFTVLAMIFVDSMLDLIGGIGFYFQLTVKTDVEAEVVGYRFSERQTDRERQRQRDRETERQRDRER